MVINLYTMKGCPRCKIIKDLCSHCDKISTNDFKEIIIDPSDELDTDVQLLKEKGIETLPILLVDDDFMDFGRAVKFLTS